MPVRLRLIVLPAALLVALVPAEWLLVRSLTRDVSLEVSEVASSVGRDVVRVFERTPLDKPAAEPSPGMTSVQVIHESGILDLPSPGQKGPSHRYLLSRVRVVGPDGSVQESQSRNELLPRKEVAPGNPRFLFIEGPERSTRIPIPEKGIESTMDRFRNRLLAGSAAILGIGLLAAVFVADRLRAAGKAELDSRDQRHLGELGEVARGLAHALRNPLHAVGLTLDELAARSPDDAEVEEMTVSARRQIRRVDDSIRSFLALANGGAGTEEDVDLSTLVSDVALEAAQDARGHAGVDVTLPEPERIAVRGLAPELRAAVQALVVNAVETQAGAVRVTLGRSDAGEARIVVEDAGPGLPPGIRERLFTPHVTTKPSGSGMGLYLAHRIATTRYGGHLALEDREGGGTRAVLTLGARRQGTGA